MSAITTTQPIKEDPLLAREIVPRRGIGWLGDERFEEAIRIILPALGPGVVNETIARYITSLDSNVAHSGTEGPAALEARVDIGIVCEVVEHVIVGGRCLLL